MAEHAIKVKGYLNCETIREKSMINLIPFKFIGNYLQKVYCKVHNRFAKVFNEHIDEWNDEFGKKYPDKDGYSIEYNSFICRKCNKILRTYDHCIGPIARYELDDDGMAFFRVYFLGHKIDFTCEKILD